MEPYLYEDLYKLEDSHWWHIAKRKMCVALIDRYIKFRNLKILEIGCGTGRNIQELMHFGNVWGIDSSAHAISFCRKRGLKKVSLGISEKIDHKDCKFDLVAMLDVLEHTEDTKTVKEVKRILKPHGYFLITVPAFMWLLSKWDEVLHHKRRYTKNSLSQTLEGNGFEIVKISYAFSFLVLPVVITRFIKSIIYKKEYPSDFKLSLPLINKIGNLACMIERWIILKFSIPLGTSVVCLARKI